MQKSWIPSKRMFAIAVLIGAALGIAESIYDLRKQRQDTHPEGMREETVFSDAVESNGSGNEGSGAADGASSGSNVSM